MGIEMFINEGLFRGIKLIFVDRSLFNEGQQGIVCHILNETENDENCILFYCCFYNSEFQVSLTKINFYTIIQILLLWVLILLKGSTTTALFFPLGLLALIYVRLYILPRIFTKKELAQLDPIIAHEHSE